MIWILIRHAHRDTSDRARDNSLSKKGREQAENLAKHFKKWLRDSELAGVDLWTSPAKRCQETIAPIAKLADAKVQVADTLGERGILESESAFTKRISRFLSDRTQKNRAQVICSHGDWIPSAVTLLTGGSVDVKKGSWIEIEDDQLIRILTPEDLA